MALITDAPQSVRQMSAARVAVLALCVVASGPTALEANLSAGGGLWTVVFLLLMPLVICLPQILIVAELSSMMPTQAGAVVWVTRGLGPRFGFMYGWTAATMSLSDVALPVILCQQLMFRLFEIQNESVGWFWVLLLRCAILGITVIFAFRSLNSVSLLTAPATGICILVVSIGFAAASPRLTWDAIAHRTAAEKTNWGVLAAATLWQYNGWITVGATSGEAKDHTAFVRGAILALGGCVVQYLLATFVMIAVADGPNDFKMEMYVIVAFQKALTGLGLVMNVLLIVLTVSSAAVALSLNARQMWGLSRFGWLPESFGKVTEDGTPYVLQLIIAACTVPIIFVDFTVALVVFYTLSAINQSWVPIAQWELRRLRNASRPFEVPGGAGLNALVVATPLFGMGGVVVMNIFDNPMMVLVSFAALATIAGVALTATSLFVPFDAAVPEESTTLVKTRPPPGYPGDSVTRELQLRGFI